MAANESAKSGPDENSGDDIYVQSLYEKYSILRVNFAVSFELPHARFASMPIVNNFILMTNNHHITVIIS